MANIIQQLKDNEKPFGLMSEEMQEKAREIEPPGNFLFFTPYRPNGGIEWALMAGEQNELHNHFTYRLRADYEDEPEIVECEIYNKESQTRGCYIKAYDFGNKTGLGLAQYPDGYKRIGFKFEDGTILGCPVMYHFDNNRADEIHGLEMEDVTVLHATHVLFRRNKL